MSKKYFMTDSLAFKLWRACRSPSTCFAKQILAVYEPSYPNSHHGAMIAHWLSDAGICPPFDILVANQSQRRSSHPLFASHLAPSFPEHSSFYRVVSPEVACFPFEVYVSSPELSFIQMAKRLTFVQTIGYGYELCGAYTPDECSKDEPEKLLKLSSSERLSAYCNRLVGIHGVKRARKAARHVLDDSRSIKETELAMMLTLPRRLRGLGVEKPSLNYDVHAHQRRESFVSQDIFTIDLCWPEYLVGVEVDTNKFHGNRSRQIKDARRRNSLQYLGYRIIEATQGDLSSALGIAGLAKNSMSLWAYGRGGADSTSILRV